MNELLESITTLESNIVECDRVIEKLLTIRHEIYTEVNKYLYVIERQKARAQSNLGTLEKAKGIIEHSTQASKKGWREEVLLRDRFTCRRCGATENLTAHHVIPKALCGEDIMWTTTNGITLCQTCHSEWHDNHENGTNIQIFLAWLNGML